ncbi:MAG: hypothetical protein ACI8QS_002151 [Planctomycetota bacterium]|jgi:hypothetical protein
METDPPLDPFRGGLGRKRLISFKSAKPACRFLLHDSYQLIKP